MKKQFYSSDLFLNIVRVGVVISGMCFMGDGCKNSMTPEEVVSAYAGTWELNSTYFNEDIIFVHRALLTINKDSTFTSNASFFIRGDSLRSQPISGKWSFTPRSAVLSFLTSSLSGADGSILFSSGSLGRSWGVSGSAKIGYMYWSRGEETDYQWNYVK
jgi:hypothetical protein